MLLENLAAIYYARSMLDECIKIFEALVDMDEPSARTLYLLGCSYLTIGKQRRANICWSVLTERYPDSPLLEEIEPYLGDGDQLYDSDKSTPDETPSAGDRIARSIADDRNENRSDFSDQQEEEKTADSARSAEPVDGAEPDTAETAGANSAAPNELPPAPGGRARKAPMYTGPPIEPVVLTEIVGNAPVPAANPDSVAPVLAAATLVEPKVAPPSFGAAGARPAPPAGERSLPTGDEPMVGSTDEVDTSAVGTTDEVVEHEAASNDENEVPAKTEAEEDEKLRLRLSAHANRSEIDTSSIEGLLANSPDNPAVIDWAAFEFYTRGLHERALELYTQLLDTGYSNEQVYYCLGSIHAYREQFDDARHLWSKLLESYPRHPLAGRARAKLAILDDR